MKIEATCYFRYVYQPMDSIVLLLLFGMAIYIYVSYFGTHPDELDRKGRSSKRSSRKG